MESNVVPFTGEYSTRRNRAENITEDVMAATIETLHHKHGFKTNEPEFIANIAWVMKFMKVVVDDELGLANELSRELKCQQFE